MPEEDRSARASRIGKAVEHLVAATCILQSGTKLNASTSLVDDEGVDVVFHRRGGTATLGVQVKARTTDTANVRKDVGLWNVRAATFRPRDDLYMLFVIVDQGRATIEHVYLVPSADFDQLANSTGKGMRRITASLKPTANDKWRPFRLEEPSDLAAALLRILDELEQLRG